MKTAFKTGCVLSILTAALHLVGHFQEPRPENDQERQLLELMRGLRFDAGGVTRSMQDILGGLSLSFTVLMLLMGVHGLLIARAGDARLVRTSAWVYAAAATAVTAIGVVCFPTPAFVCTGLVGAAYLVASRARS